MGKEYNLDGYIGVRDASIIIDIPPNRYNILNATDITVDYTIDTDEVSVLGHAVTMRVPTNARIDGSMTIHVDSGLWSELVKYHIGNGSFPRVTIVLENADNSDPGLGRKRVSLSGVVFTKLPLFQGSAGDAAYIKAELPFTANAIDIIEDYRNIKLDA